jgi:hypothetical protein
MHPLRVFKYAVHARPTDLRLSRYIGNRYLVYKTFIFNNLYYFIYLSQEPNYGETENTV